jgi:molybdopterin converting factor small subunit
LAADSEEPVASTVRIPTVLRPAVGGQATATAEGTTIGDVLDDLASRHPGVREQLFNADGTLHRFLNVYVNDDDVRYIGGLAAPVAAGDEITLLPAVAGGCAP